MSPKAEFNRDLGLRINREIWNGGDLRKVGEYFSSDFVADRSPYGVIRGLDELAASVVRSRAAFEGFREDVKTVVADDDHVVIHFTIRGRHTGPWGPLQATGREVAFDEIVIMKVRDGQVCELSGVIDNLTGLRQVGAIPAPPQR
jgi:predicted ester cyclase